MLLSKQELVSFVFGRIRSIRPDLETALLAALDAIEAGAPLSDSSFQSIVDAASSNRLPVYEFGAALLREIAEGGGRVPAVLERMSKSTSAHIRHNALLCLNERIPIDVRINVVCRGLKDKSVRVRRKAADMATTLRLKAVLPNLAEAEAVESDQETRELMAHELQMLRDGYSFQASGDDMTYISIDSPLGGRLGITVSNREVEKRGLAAVVSSFLSSQHKIS